MDVWRRILQRIFFQFCLFLSIAINRRHKILFSFTIDAPLPPAVGGGRRSQHPVYCSPHGPGTESHPATAPRSADHGSLFSASAHRQSPGPWAAASGCPPEPPPTAKSARDGGAADATPPPVRQTLMTSQFEKKRPRLVC